MHSQPFDTCCFFNTKVKLDTTIYKAMFGMMHPDPCLGSLMWEFQGYGPQDQVHPWPGPFVTPRSAEPRDSEGVAVE